MLEVHFSGGAPVLKTSLPDIGNLATWSVSSFKYGFDVECLRDDDPETFWQSDGPQPHSITLQFSKKVKVQKIAILLDIGQDDSYTPTRLTIRAGTGHYDLQDIKNVNLQSPSGWITFDAGAELTRDGKAYKPLEIYAIQVMIAANHLNGKDTHVRGLRILGPPKVPVRDDDTSPFTSIAFKMHEFIR
ncbi:hypothetical protein BOTBODRAFT_31310 [Botryobasidium botryosum FD-172 SS1]|uniref:Anaphase-promoting complex subunit 10 n=1 Tax=Botryobasidium botryosum (strain FD-172 SS1) TaxID=930990 RepID=A0A067MVI8_BOTB1|nr:hypothetical protein BOTBODRAFT_31310 [Botryobasidium botryosum FD-172 SS1]